MRRTLILLVLVGVTALPVLALSAPLVPCNGPDCQACHLVELAQRVLKWLIGVMASVIALVFAMGGFKMVTAGGDTGAVSGAREMMKNAVIGFLILLSAWLIINTLLLTFTNKGGLELWGKIECVPPPPPVAVTPPPVTEECADDAALIAKYKGSPVGAVAPGLQALISCYMADSAVAEATDSSQLYTVDRSHPRCSLTNGNPVCGTCSHSSNSCHYGRGSGAGAKAVDFNAKAGFTEAQLFSRLQARRATCGGTLITEGDHSHISMPGC